ncbi:putative uncharacterized protein DDB_G0271606 isoform X2 [Cloeon dipterum]|uniref:putative uncharacterized protein DDB_G0271606 isoform X2 n=1 Tax=Cloeon dipterum TaxID=197152 RepID=UPI0032204092
MQMNQVPNVQQEVVAQDQGAADQLQGQGPHPIQGQMHDQVAQIQQVGQIQPQEGQMQQQQQFQMQQQQQPQQQQQMPQQFQMQQHQQQMQVNQQQQQMQMQQQPQQVAGAMQMNQVPVPNVQQVVAQHQGAAGQMQGQGPHPIQGQMHGQVTQIQQVGQIQPQVGQMQGQVGQMQQQHQHPQQQQTPQRLLWQHTTPQGRRQYFHLDPETHQKLQSVDAAQRQVLIQKLQEAAARQASALADKNNANTRKMHQLDLSV